MKIAVASNHIGFQAKNRVLSQIRQMEHDVFDFGPETDEACDYPDYAAAVAEAVSVGALDRGVLIGGTGIGMSIVANKYRGIHAALCQDSLSVELSRRHHDSNVLCLSADLVSEELAWRMIETWLVATFDGGQHARRLAKIIQLENELWDERELKQSVAAVMETNNSKQ